MNPESEVSTRPRCKGRIGRFGERERNKTPAHPIDNPRLACCPGRSAPSAARAPLSRIAPAATRALSVADRAGGHARSPSVADRAVGLIR
jgi:hypothetical protein